MLYKSPRETHTSLAKLRSFSVSERLVISGSVEFELAGAVALKDDDEESFDMEKSLSERLLEGLLVCSTESGKSSVYIITLKYRQK